VASRSRQTIGFGLITLEERGRAYFNQGNFNVAAAAFSRANELEKDAYSAVWHYLARERGGENGAAELEANAARLRSKGWPYPVIELYLGRRSPAEVLSLASKPEERCEAQFYTGEWYLLRGDRTAAATALQAAANICSKEFRLGRVEADEPLMPMARIRRLSCQPCGRQPLNVTTPRVEAVLVFGKGRCEPPQPIRQQM
jgi:tetratricopeptide (TPR) repeat protein